MRLSRKLSFGSIRRVCGTTDCFLARTICRLLLLFLPSVDRARGLQWKFINHFLPQHIYFRIQSHTELFFFSPFSFPFLRFVVLWVILALAHFVTYIRVLLRIRVRAQSCTLKKSPQKREKWVKTRSAFPTWKKFFRLSLDELFSPDTDRCLIFHDIPESDGAKSPSGDCKEKCELNSEKKKNLTFITHSVLVKTLRQNENSAPLAESGPDHIKSEFTARPLSFVYTNTRGQSSPQPHSPRLTLKTPKGLRTRRERERGCLFK